MFLVASRTFFINMCVDILTLSRLGQNLDDKNRNETIGQKFDQFWSKNESKCTSDKLKDSRRCACAKVHGCAILQVL
jgi:hypothetical protein